eukprot:g807.t1
MEDEATKGICQTTWEWFKGTVTAAESITVVKQRDRFVAKFRYDDLSSAFDEWIALDSKRIVCPRGSSSPKKETDPNERLTGPVRLAQQMSILGAAGYRRVAERVSSAEGDDGSKRERVRAVLHEMGSSERQASDLLKESLRLRQRLEAYAATSSEIRCPEDTLESLVQSPVCPKTQQSLVSRAQYTATTSMWQLFGARIRILPRLRGRVVALDPVRRRWRVEYDEESVSKEVKLSLCATKNGISIPTSGKSSNGSPLRIKKNVVLHSIPIHSKRRTMEWEMSSLPNWTGLKSATYTLSASCAFDDTSPKSWKDEHSVRFRVRVRTTSDKSSVVVYESPSASKRSDVFSCALTLPVDAESVSLEITPHNGGELRKDICPVWVVPRIASVVPSAGDWDLCETPFLVEGNACVDVLTAERSVEVMRLAIQRADIDATSAEVSALDAATKEVGHGVALETVRQLRKCGSLRRGRTIELRRPLSAGLDGDKHHLHIKQIVVHDENGDKIDLVFDSGSESVTHVGGDLLGPESAIDDDLTSHTHSAYQGEWKTRHKTMDHFMKFVLKPTRTAVSKVTVINRDTHCDRLEKAILKLCLPDEDRTCEYEVKSAGKRVQWNVPRIVPSVRMCSSKDKVIDVVDSRKIRVPLTRLLEGFTASQWALKKGDLVEFCAEDSSWTTCVVESVRVVDLTKIISSKKSDDATVRRSPQVGDSVEVLDTVNIWRRATILSIKGTVIRIHYEGWQSKWDEDISLDVHHERICFTPNTHIPFGTDTGYKPKGKKGYHTSIVHRSSSVAKSSSSSLSDRSFEYLCCSNFVFESRNDAKAAVAQDFDDVEPLHARFERYSNVAFTGASFIADRTKLSMARKSGETMESFVRRAASTCRRYESAGCRGFCIVSTCPDDTRCDFLSESFVFPPCKVTRCNMPRSNLTPMVVTSACGLNVFARNEQGDYESVPFLRKHIEASTAVHVVRYDEEWAQLTDGSFVRITSSGSDSKPPSSSSAATKSPADVDGDCRKSTRLLERDVSTCTVYLLNQVKDDQWQNIVECLRERLKGKDISHESRGPANWDLHTLISALTSPRGLCQIWKDENAALDIVKNMLVRCSEVSESETKSTSVFEYDEELHQVGAEASCCVPALHRIPFAILRMALAKTTSESSSRVLQSFVRIVLQHSTKSLREAAARAVTTTATRAAKTLWSEFSVLSDKSSLCLATLAAIPSLCYREWDDDADVNAPPLEGVINDLRDFVQALDRLSIYVNQESNEILDHNASSTLLALSSSAGLAGGLISDEYVRIESCRSCNDGENTALRMIASASIISPLSATTFSASPLLKARSTVAENLTTKSSLPGHSETIWIRSLVDGKRDMFAELDEHLKKTIEVTKPRIQAKKCIEVFKNISNGDTGFELRRALLTVCLRRLGFVSVARKYHRDFLRSPSMTKTPKELRDLWICVRQFERRLFNKVKRVNTGKMNNIADQAKRISFLQQTYVAVSKRIIDAISCLFGAEEDSSVEDGSASSESDEPSYSPVSSVSSDVEGTGGRTIDESREYTASSILGNVSGVTKFLLSFVSDDESVDPTALKSAIRKETKRCRIRQYGLRIILNFLDLPAWKRDNETKCTSDVLVPLSDAQRRSRWSRYLATAESALWVFQHTLKSLADVDQSFNQEGNDDAPVRRGGILCGISEASSLQERIAVVRSWVAIRKNMARIVEAVQTIAPVASNRCKDDKSNPANMSGIEERDDAKEGIASALKLKKDPAHMRPPNLQKVKSGRYLRKSHPRYSDYHGTQNSSLPSESTDGVSPSEKESTLMDPPPPRAPYMPPTLIMSDAVRLLHTSMSAIRCCGGLLPLNDSVGARALSETNVVDALRGLIRVKSNPSFDVSVRRLLRSIRSASFRVLRALLLQLAVANPLASERSSSLPTGILEVALQELRSRVASYLSSSLGSDAACENEEICFELLRLLYPVTTHSGISLASKPENNTLLCALFAHPNCSSRIRRRICEFWLSVIPHVDAFDRTTGVLKVHAKQKLSVLTEAVERSVLCGLPFPVAVMTDDHANASNRVAKCAIVSNQRWRSIIAKRKQDEMRDFAKRTSVPEELLWQWLDDNANWQNYDKNASALLECAAEAMSQYPKDLWPAKSDEMIKETPSPTSTSVVLKWGSIAKLRSVHLEDGRTCDIDLGEMSQHDRETGKSQMIRRVGPPGRSAVFLAMVAKQQSVVAERHRKMLRRKKIEGKSAASKIGSHDSFSECIAGAEAVRLLRTIMHEDTQQVLGGGADDDCRRSSNLAGWRSCVREDVVQRISALFTSLRNGKRTSDLSLVSFSEKESLIIDALVALHIVGSFVDPLYVGGTVRVLSSIATESSSHCAIPGANGIEEGTLLSVVRASSGEDGAFRAVVGLDRCGSEAFEPRHITPEGIRPISIASLRAKDATKQSTSASSPEMILHILETCVDVYAISASSSTTVEEVPRSDAEDSSALSSSSSDEMSDCDRLTSMVPFDRMACKRALEHCDGDMDAAAVMLSQGMHESEDSELQIAREERDEIVRWDICEDEEDGEEEDGDEDDDDEEGTSGTTNDEEMFMMESDFGVEMTDRGEQCTWQFQDGRRWRDYDIVQQKKITAYYEGGASQCEVRGPSGKYKIFLHEPFYQINLRTRKRRTVRRVPRSRRQPTSTSVTEVDRVALKKLIDSKDKSWSQKMSELKRMVESVGLDFELLSNPGAIDKRACKTIFESVSNPKTNIINVIRLIRQCPTTEVVERGFQRLDMCVAGNQNVLSKAIAFHERAPDLIVACLKRHVKHRGVVLQSLRCIIDLCQRSAVPQNVREFRRLGLARALVSLFCDWSQDSDILGFTMGAIRALSLDNKETERDARMRKFAFPVIATELQIASLHNLFRWATALIADMSPEILKRALQHEVNERTLKYDIEVLNIAARRCLDKRHPSARVGDYSKVSSDLKKIIDQTDRVLESTSKEKIQLSAKKEALPDSSDGDIRSRLHRSRGNIAEKGLRKERKAMSARANIASIQANNATSSRNVGEGSLQIDQVFFSGKTKFEHRFFEESGSRGNERYARRAHNHMLGRLPSLRNFGTASTSLTEDDDTMRFEHHPNVAVDESDSDMSIDQLVKQIREEDNEAKIWVLLASLEVALAAYHARRCTWSIRRISSDVRGGNTSMALLKMSLSRGSHELSVDCGDEDDLAKFVESFPRSDLMEFCATEIASAVRDKSNIRWGARSLLLSDQAHMRTPAVEATYRIICSLVRMPEREALSIPESLVRALKSALSSTNYFLVLHAARILRVIILCCAKWEDVVHAVALDAAKLSSILTKVDSWEMNRSTNYRHPLVHEKLGQELFGLLVTLNQCNKRGTATTNNLRIESPEDKCSLERRLVRVSGDVISVLSSSGYGGQSKSRIFRMFFNKILSERAFDSGAIYPGVVRNMRYVANILATEEVAPSDGAALRLCIRVLRHESAFPALLHPILEMLRAVTEACVAAHTKDANAARLCRSIVDLDLPSILRKILQSRTVSSVTQSSEMTTLPTKKSSISSKVPWNRTKFAPGDIVLVKVANIGKMSTEKSKSYEKLAKRLSRDLQRELERSRPKPSDVETVKAFASASTNAATRALMHTGNNTNMAVNWLFENVGRRGLEDPLPPPPTPKFLSLALRQCEGDVQKSVEWARRNASRMDALIKEMHEDSKTDDDASNDSVVEAEIRTVGSASGLDVSVVDIASKERDSSDGFRGGGLLQVGDIVGAQSISTGRWFQATITKVVDAPSTKHIESKKYRSFNGSWSKGRIAGDTLTWKSSGARNSVKWSEDEETIEVSLRGVRHTAKLSEDRNTIIWSDGDRWSRKADEMVTDTGKRYDVRFDDGEIREGLQFCELLYRWTK